MGRRMRTSSCRQSGKNGARVIGWIIEIIAVLMFLGAAVLGIWDCICLGIIFSGFCPDMDTASETFSEAVV